MTFQIIRMKSPLGDDRSRNDIKQVLSVRPKGPAVNSQGRQPLVNLPLGLCRGAAGSNPWQTSSSFKFEPFPTEKSNGELFTNKAVLLDFLFGLPRTG
jgi:hypothetical protein